jgi:hypothetical protein
MSRRFIGFVVAIISAVMAASSCTHDPSPSKAGRVSSTSATGAAAGRGASSSGGVVHLTAYSDNDGPTATAILTGAIADVGETIRMHDNGSNSDHALLEVRVSHGSFELNIAELQTALTHAFAHFPTDTATCSGLVTAHAKAPVVDGSGAGEYGGIAGSFALTVTVNEVDPWPRCSASSLLAQTVFLSGVATVGFS